MTTTTVPSFSSPTARDLLPLKRVEVHERLTAWLNVGASAARSTSARCQPVLIEASTQSTLIDEAGPAPREHALDGLPGMHTEATARPTTSRMKR
jgi:hypothetical protein